jgi:predicted phage-related endonuclease
MPTIILANDTDIIYQLYPQEQEGKIVELNDKADAIASSIDSMQADAKDLEAKIDKLKNELKVLLGNAEVGTTKNWRITWKTQSKKSYVVPASKSRVFKVKSIGGKNENI